ELVRGAICPLHCVARDGLGAVSSLRLELEKSAQRIRQLGTTWTNPFDEPNRFVVALALGMLAERLAANRVSSRNARVDAIGHEDVADVRWAVCQVPNLLGRIEKLNRHLQTPSHHRLIAGLCSHRLGFPLCARSDPNSSMPSSAACLTTPRRSVESG